MTRHVLLNVPYLDFFATPITLAVFLPRRTSRREEEDEPGDDIRDIKEKGVGMEVGMEGWK